ncbi:hypothetical protein ABZY42_18190 [Streptomyces sp. NPDC006622]|uniref:hypothetical protein n=1 Tax=Streptomyces sp. NPDC006622 TaxID=3155459 RepID=UPI0033BB307C
MRRITALIIAAALAVAGGVTVTVIWLMQPSYDDITRDCQKALAEQYKAHSKGAPTACNDVKKDDYDALVLNGALGNLGWTDEDGNFDKNKTLEDTLNNAD